MDDDSKNILKREDTNKLFDILKKLLSYQLDIKKVPVEWAGGESTNEFSVYFDCSYFIATTNINPCPFIHDFMKRYYNEVYFTVTLTNADTSSNYVMKKKESGVPSMNKRGETRSHSLTKDEFERLEENFRDYLNSIDPNFIVIKRPTHYETSKTTSKTIVYDN